jgi:hypothetical protein
MFQQRKLSKAIRSLCFDVIDRHAWTRKSIFMAMITNKVCLGRKARLLLRCDDTKDVSGYRTMCWNSYKALDVVLETVLERGGFLDEGEARLLLSKSYQSRRGASLGFPVEGSGMKSAKDEKIVPGMMAWKWSCVSDRRLIAAPYVRYARAVIPKFGKEKIFGFMRGHLLAVDRSIRFLTDVLQDVKENGLDGSDFEGLFEGIKIIAELKPPFDRALFERFGELLENPDISGRYEFARREEMVGLIHQCLEPEDS